MSTKFKLMMPTAVAVILATAAPVQAEGLKGFYAQARIGVQYSDPGDGAESDTTIESFASRIGYKTEKELGNGLTGFGRLEFQIDAEDSDADENGVRDTTKIRLGYAGVKGDFGSIRIGQDYHTFFNYTVAPVDVPWWFAGENMLSYVGRTGDGLTYTGTFGGLSFGATAYLESGDEDDGVELGLSYDFGPVKLGVATRDLDSFDDALTAFTVSGKAGGVGLAATFQDQGDADSVEANISYGSFYATVGEANDRAATTLGYTLNLGPKTLMWFELFKKEAAEGAADDSFTAIATLKYDIF